MRPRLLAITKKVVPIAFYVLLAVFLVLYLDKVDWHKLAGLHINWVAAVIATVISLGFRYWGVQIWFFILRRLGAVGLKGSYGILTYVYAKSWMGRYIPGAATWIVGKVYFASRYGVSKSRLGVSGILEGALQIVSTLALALAILLLDHRATKLDPWFIALMVAAFVGCMVCLIPQVFGFLIGMALKIFRRKPIAPSSLPTLSTTLSAFVLYVVGSLLSGIAYFFIASAVYPHIKISDAPFVVGAASLASAVSMLVVFAPGGLGVREGIQALLLSAIMPAPIALVIVVVTRLWSVAVDGLFFLTAAVPMWIRRPVVAVPPKEDADKLDEAPLAMAPGEGSASCSSSGGCGRVM